MKYLRARTRITASVLDQQCFKPIHHKFPKMTVLGTPQCTIFIRCDEFLKCKPLDDRIVLHANDAHGKSHTYVRPPREGWYEVGEDNTRKPIKAKDLNSALNKTVLADFDGRRTSNKAVRRLDLEVQQ